MVLNFRLIGALSELVNN